VISAAMINARLRPWSWPP